MAANLPMHPVFTLVYQRSFDAYVNPNKMQLDAVMASFVIDPQEAEDAFEQRGVEGTPHSLKFIADRGKRFFSAALETISQWVLCFEDTRKIIAEITAYDVRLGVWCATRVVRKLRAYPPEPVAVAEAFVMSGERTNEGRVAYDRYRGLMRLNERAYAEWNAAVQSACYVALASSLSQSTVTMASAITPKVVGMAAYSLVLQEVEFVEDVTARDELRQLIVLRDVIAEGCLSYPVIP